MIKKQRIWWLLITCLMLISLLMASCSSSDSTETSSTTSGTTTTTTPGPEMVTDSLGRLVEKPQYGGTMTIPLETPERGLDDNFGSASDCHVLHYVCDSLITGPWEKSPTGSNECSWFGNRSTVACMGPRIAESWEFPDSATCIWHLRDDVYWQDKAPMNGRQFVADDVVFNINRWFGEGGRLASSAKWFVSIEALDNLTVKIVGDPQRATIGVLFPTLSNYMHMLPPEVIQQYGDMTNWENVVGTGAFSLQDYVVGSSSTLVRNPDYYMMDPLHPDNRLPYIDKLVMLEMTDYSTRLAAFRTGQVDWANLITADDGDKAIADFPTLKWNFDLNPTAEPIFMRTDMAPFNDVRVRRALRMAINQDAIVQGLYDGKAEALCYPVAPVADYIAGYTPVSEMPAEIKEIYTYNPTKAKELLTAAGHPNGFTTEILCTSAHEEILSLYIDYWAAIGVTVTMNVKEASVWTSEMKSKTYNGMGIDVSSLGNPGEFVDYQVLSDGSFHAENMSRVNDAYINDMVKKIAAWDIYTNTAAQFALIKETNLHILSQVYSISPPVPKSYNLWWPWIKSYSGEFCVGHLQKYFFANYLWIDQKLKTSMGH